METPFGVGRVSSLQLCAKGGAKDIFHSFWKSKSIESLRFSPLAPFETSTTFSMLPFYLENFFFLRLP